MDLVGGIPILEELEVLNRVEVIHTLFEYEMYFAYAKDAIVEKPVLAKLCSTLAELEKEGAIQAIVDERTRSIKGLLDRSRQKK